MRRRIRCPQGRLIYRWSDEAGPLAAGLIATRAELARRRRRLADGQEPVGSLWVVRRYVPLYAVAGSVALAPLSAKRQAAWEAARMCVQCGEARQTPVPRREGRTPAAGQRWCYPCVQTEKDTAHAAQRNADRADAETQALDILSDPACLIVAVQHLPESSSRRWRLTAVNTHGDLVTDYTHTDARRGDGVMPGDVKKALAAAVGPLAGKRLAVWREYDLSPLKSQLFRAALTAEETAEWDARGQVRTPAGPFRDLEEALAVKGWQSCPRKIGDQIGAVVFHWRPIDLPAPYARGRDDLQVYSVLCGAPLDSLAAMHLEVLRRIAAGTHPAGPARCPHRAHSKTPPCGDTCLTATGLCRAHSPAPEGHPS